MIHKINIIYYIWINTKRNWKVIIHGQFFDIKISKIFENAKLHIVLSCEDNNVLTLSQNKFKKYLKNQTDSV